MLTDFPMASLAEYPYIRSAPAFQLVMIPSSVLPIIASSEHATIEANRRRSSSVRLLPLISRIALETNIPCFVSNGLSLISTGNSLPSLRKPKSSSPASSRAFQRGARKRECCSLC